MLYYNNVCTVIKLLIIIIDINTLIIANNILHTQLPQNRDRVPSLYCHRETLQEIGGKALASLPCLLSDPAAQFFQENEGLWANYFSLKQILSV